MPRLPPDDSTDAAARRGARLAVGLFVAMSSLFILSSTWQLSKSALFPASGRADPSLVDACAARLRPLRTAVEDALRAAASAPDEHAALVAFEAQLRPSWAAADAVKAECDARKDGADAFAAVARLRAAAGSVARRRALELALARRDVAVFLDR